MVLSSTCVPPGSLRPSCRHAWVVGHRSRRCSLGGRPDGQGHPPEPYRNAADKEVVGRGMGRALVPHSSKGVVTTALVLIT